LGLTCQGAELLQLLQLHTSQEKAETNSPNNFTIKTFEKLNSKMGDLNPPQHTDLKHMTAEFLSNKQIFFRVYAPSQNKQQHNCPILQMTFHSYPLQRQANWKK
jgi:hypothetical protein